MNQQLTKKKKFKQKILMVELIIGTINSITHVIITIIIIIIISELIKLARNGKEKSSIKLI